MKGVLHIYIDWQHVCANMWRGLGWVVHTKYHPSKYKVCRQTKLSQGQNERCLAHLQLYYNRWAPSMCKYVKRFELGRAHKVPPVFVTDARTHAWTWILCPPVRSIHAAGDKKVANVCNNTKCQVVSILMWMAWDVGGMGFGIIGVAYEWKPIKQIKHIGGLFGRCRNSLQTKINSYITIVMILMQ